MKTKKKLLADYNENRGALLFLSLFSFLDMLCVLIRGGTTVPFITLPVSLFGCFSAVIVDWAARLCAAPFYLISVAFFVFCYIKSSKHESNWLKAAAIAYSADTLLLLILFSTMKKGMLLFGLIFHLGVLFLLISALLSAKKLLSGDSSQNEKDDETEEYESEKHNTKPEIISHLSKESSVVYSFDRNYATANKTNMVGIFLFSLLCYIILGIGAVCLAVEITDIIDADIEVTLIAMALPFALLTILFIILAVRLAPFLTAGNATFLVSKEGTFSRAMPAELPHLRYIEFHSAQLIKEKHNCWIISYFTPRGRRKKCVIPKAYPKLEDYINTLR